MKTRGDTTQVTTQSPGPKQGAGAANNLTTIRFSPMDPSATAGTVTDMLGTLDADVDANGRWDRPEDIENQAYQLDSIRKSRGVMEERSSVDTDEKPEGLEDKVRVWLRVSNAIVISLTQLSRCK